jgi:RNA polymerase sigma-70 factor (ECF subfamily)
MRRFMTVSPERLSACHALGQQAWTDLDPGLERLAAHVQRLGLDEATLERHAEDLFLVVAVLEGDARALAALDRAFLRPACMVAARIDGGRPFLDDVEQQLRLKLLAGPEPKLRDYAGTGGLLEWLRVAALRTAMNLKRSDRRLVPSDELPIDPMSLIEGTNIEVQALKGRYLEDFRRALEASFLRLGVRERTLLRLHFVDGLNIDAIGTIYGAHRATVARWLVAIRRALFDEMRSVLAGQHMMGSHSVRSLYRLLEPELHLTLSRLLIDPPAGGGAVRSG